MGSSLDDKYSVTRVAAKVAWYSSCVRWSRGGAIVRSVGGRIVWVVGWGCGRGFSGRVFVKGLYLGYYDGILPGRELGVSLGRDMEVSWGNLEWTLAG